jgi:hypothetical protein
VKPHIDTALIILLLTAATYCSAFWFQAGYFSYFGVPMEFAEVGLKELSIAGAGALCTVMLSVGLLGMSLVYRLRSVRWVARVLSAVAAITSTIVLGYLFHFSGAEWSILLIVATLVLWGWLAPMWSRKEPPAPKGVESGIDRDRTAAIELLPVLSRYGIWFILLGLISLFYAAFGLGKFSAHRQIRFMVDDKDHCNVIRPLSEGLLCIDRSQPGAPHYRFIEAKNVELVIRAVGPLPPVDIRPQKTGR